ncbi:MAG: hypothetical protein OEZ14_08250, partial [Acidimicrobiia bacterium]|nr:hypothetical protein [Acidimicrobiia bacterium]
MQLRAIEVVAAGVECGGFAPVDPVVDDVGPACSGHGHRFVVAAVAQDVDGNPVGGRMVDGRGERPGTVLGGDEDG